MMSSFVQQRIREQLQSLDADGLRREPRTADSLPCGRCLINGQELINFGSNDYLGLAHDPRVCEAFREVAANQVGATASSLITGRSSHHVVLERQLAEFEQCESVLLFPTGFAANAGILQALATSDDVIFSESENHASLIDGCRGTKSHVRIYDRHRLDDFRVVLQECRSTFDGGFIVTDGVFSMDGTVAPLQELCDLADEFHLAVIVDEAHGTGVLGNHGRGASELAGVEHRTFLRIGTLSKALGGLGGFVAGCHNTIEWLRNRARTQFFSTAAPPAVCAAVSESLKIVETEPERRSRLSELNQSAREHAQAAGLTLIGDGLAPIIAVSIPDPADTIQVSTRLQAEGWFVPAILPPTVATGTSRLRLSLTADHQISDVHSAIDTIAGIMAPV